ncbi:MAG: GyrI-like domain-containing protein [Mycobacterium leprae]
MAGEVRELGELKIVGVELPNADPRAHLILYLWGKLAARMPEVEGPIDPHILYGVWHRKGRTTPSYILGVQVSAVGVLPEGLVSVHVPAYRYGTVTLKGAPDFGRAYEQLERYIKANHRELVPADATVEIYDTRQEVSDEYTVTLCQPICH